GGCPWLPSDSEEAARCLDDCAYDPLVGSRYADLDAVGEKQFHPLRLHQLHGQEGFEVGRSETA
ncbi:MAG: hypothetical protein K6T59_15365, partial [Bryobacteraceae bacterium]|nr:hypothetical protein [Bryobacteraceae bacterium]